MIRLKSILSEIYLDGFSSSDEKSKFRRPENFDSYDKGAGWSSYRGGNDWENGTTACAVYFEGKEGELARTWVHLQFPDHLKEFVGSHSSSPESIQVKEWGEKAAKTWTKLAKRIHRESKHQVNENDPNSSWLYKDWKECFVEALKSEEMKPFVKEWGVDSTHWKGMKQSLNENSDKHFKAWWIDPNTKLHEVYVQSKSDGHWNWAINFLAAAGLQRTEYEDPLEQLYKRGWARLTYNYYHDGVLAFEYGVRYPSPNVLKAIKDLAIELRASKLIDGNKDKEIDLMERLNEVMTYNKLMQLADKSPRGIDGLTRKQRAKTVRVRSIPVSMENGKESWNFRYASNPSNTAEDGKEPLKGSIQFFKEIKNTSTKNAADLPCHVDCNCRDFMYRWAWNDAAKDASQIGPKSLNKCINRRPKPAYNLGEGLCKHLIALEGYLRTKIKAAKKSNLFEAMEEVARTNPQFNIEYND